jgi:hypothetical protein
MRNAGCVFLKFGDDLGQEVGAGGAGGAHDKRPRARLAQFGDADPRALQDRFRAQHVIGKEAAGQSELARTAVDENDAEVALHVGDVLRHCGLTDAQFGRGARERAAPHEAAEGPQPCSHLHKYKLYYNADLCIYFLALFRLSCPCLRS